MILTKRQKSKARKIAMIVKMREETGWKTAQFLSRQ